MFNTPIRKLYASLCFVLVGVVFDIISTLIALHRYNWDFSQEVNSVARTIMSQYNLWAWGTAYLFSFALLTFGLWWIFRRVLSKLFHSNNIDMAFVVMSVLCMLILFFVSSHNLGLLNFIAWITYEWFFILSVVLIFGGGLSFLIVNESRFKKLQTTQAVS